MRTGLRRRAAYETACSRSAETMFAAWFTRPWRSCFAVAGAAMATSDTRMTIAINISVSVNPRRNGDRGLGLRIRDSEADARDNVQRALARARLWATLVPLTEFQCTVA